MKLHRTQLGYRITLGRLEIHLWLRPKHPHEHTRPIETTEDHRQDDNRPQGAGNETPLLAPPIQGAGSTAANNGVKTMA